VQPIPDSFAALCGSMFISQHVSTIDAMIESCPHPGAEDQQAKQSGRWLTLDHSGASVGRISWRSNQ